MIQEISINPQVSLTAFLPGDQPNLIRFLNDPVIYRNTLMIPSPYTDVDAENWLHLVKKNLEENGVLCNWAIRHHETGVIGGIGAFLRSGLKGHRDEIGYWLAEPFRGKGLMTEVVTRFCEFLFETRPELLRLEAKVHHYNPASARVLEKAGFEREGYARKYAFKDGEAIDTILLSRIR